MTVRIRTTSKRVVAGKKVSLLFHVITYRYIHTVGHWESYLLSQKTAIKKALFFDSQRKEQDAQIKKS